jgi:hypothetical protein
VTEALEVVARRKIIETLLGRRTWSSADLGRMFTVEQVVALLAPERPDWADLHGLPVLEMIERGWLPGFMGLDGLCPGVRVVDVEAALFRFFRVNSADELAALRPPESS